MKLKSILLLMFVLFFNELSSQTPNRNLNDFEKIYCYKWLPEFQDSFLVIVDESKLNQGEKYCVLTKAKRRNYKLRCWSGEARLETPVEWKHKLKIKFRDKSAFMKFGKKKVTYKINELGNEEYLFVRKSSKEVLKSKH